MKKIILILLSILLLASCASTKGRNYMAEVVDTETDNGDWEVKHFADNFGNPTSKVYISTPFKLGVFKNSATNGSGLGGSLLVTDNSVEIKLLEYGTHPVSVISRNAFISVQVKAGDMTETIKYNSFASNRVIVKNTEPIYKALTENDEVQIYVYISDYTTSSYIFTVSGRGFVHAYKNAFIE